ncbi:hypothetical protein FRC10_002058 [Ceratobasidium sp. 414]|nr:hypothetical protein FRC10_002058 [Ceratobasidium sp. 414]
MKKTVCRSLRDFIDTNDYLQYKLELDACGYVEPLHPRTDLGFSEKAKLLREHSARWSNPGRVTPVRYELPGFDTNGIGTFTKGTFVWNQTVGDEDFTTSVFYQLPSSNKGTKFKLWSIGLENKHGGFWIDPEQDLLVVAEARDGFPNNPPYNIHLRSMSTNRPHPRAATSRTVLRYTPPSDSRYCHGQDITIFHHLLLGSFDPRGDRTNVVIWNWTTGQELSHLTIVNHGADDHSVELLSENSFVISQSSASSDIDPTFPKNTLGWLNVYQFDPQTTVSKRATHVLSFALPASQTANYRWYTLGLDPAPTTAPPSAENRGGFPARVYNSAPGDRLLRIVHYGPTDSPPAIPVEAFHVPCSILLDELAKDAPRSTPKLVLWSEWADRVVRIPHSKSHWGSYIDTFDLRMISMPMLGYGAWPLQAPSFGVTVFDFHQRRLMSRGIRRPYSKITIPVEHTSLADIERWIEEGYQLPEEADEYYAWIDEEHRTFLPPIVVQAAEPALNA